MLHNQTRPTIGQLAHDLGCLCRDLAQAQQRLLENRQQLCRERYRIVDERCENYETVYDVETRGGDVETWTDEQTQDRLGLRGIEEWVNQGRYAA